MTAITELRKPAPAAASSGPFYEVLDAAGLAERWYLPVTWIQEQCRSRTSDPIPHTKLGRYIRFSFGSPELAAWWGRRQIGGKR